VSPPSGIDELLAALEQHRAALDLPARRLRARREGALNELTREEGERALRALGGRSGALALLEAQPEGLGSDALARALREKLPS
jgi:hypothetical protein